MRLTVTEKQFQLIRELTARKTVMSIQDSAKGVEFADFQTFTIAFAAIVKRCLISLDTGLGKTLVAAALINIMRAKNPKMKWIYVCQASNITKTVEKLSSLLYSSSVSYTTASNELLAKNFVLNVMDTVDVAVISYSCLTLPITQKYLFSNYSSYSGIIADEMHTVGNLTSYTSRLLCGLMSKMEYRYGLTATPLRVDVSQAINQIYMLDEEMFDDVELSAYIHRHQTLRHLDDLKRDIIFRYISFSRADLGLTGTHPVHIMLCEPKPEYLKLRKMETFSKVKGDPTGPALGALVQIIKHHLLSRERGIIYANLNTNKKLLRDFLEELGLHVGILDGSTTPSPLLKDRVHDAFVHDKLNVLITNVTTGRDLPADYMVFYELTFDFAQMFGRGQRGLEGNNMEVYFIIVNGTSEVDYFYENVYHYSQLQSQICNKDLELLETAKQQLDAKLGI